MDGAGAESLLALALSQPLVAAARARTILAGAPTAHQASIAHQAVAVVERDTGHLAQALVAARAALRLARRCDAEREADVLATLGATLVYAGQAAAGLRRLEQAVSLVPAGLAPRLLLRRAHIHYVTGRYEQALADIDVAIAGSRAGGDALWEARGLNTRCLIRLALGDVARAERDALAAEVKFTAIGQLLEAAHALHNRALAAHQRGHLAEALALLDAVTGRYDEIDVRPSDLAIDHAQTLLTAGLTDEARAMAAAALAGSEVQPVKRAELVLTAAQAALAAQDTQCAQDQGHQAARLFFRQGRPVWAHRATLLALQADYLASGPNPLEQWEPREDKIRHPADQRRRRLARTLRSVTRLVEAMEADASTELPLANLLHGRVAHDLGRDAEAEASLRRATESRSSGAPLARAAGWLAAALLAELTGDRRALLHACRRGLDAVDEHRAMLGDLELRALAARHGNELATMAVRSTFAAGDGRGLLWWVERWRATALVVTPMRPVLEPQLEREIAALRDVARRLDASDDPDQQSGLRQERARREAAVRRTYHHLRGSGSRQAGFDLDAVRAALGDTTLLALLMVDGTLHAVTISKGRLRRRVVGPFTTALDEARYSRFALRRAAYGRLPDLVSTGARLQHALLGAAAGLPEGGRCVVVPPAPLLTAPWGLLPAFADTELTVSPSATLWLAAHRVPPSDGHIALVTGPGLRTGEYEVTTLSPLHKAARAVRGEEATVSGALEVLEGARLAHVAAHGTFRSDAPMFSSLTLYDGPLTVHDFDRLRRPPREMVLSACDSGNAAPIGANEALGLVSSLLSLGTSTVMASVVPVNDHATVAVMQLVHEAARAGASLSVGWLAARQASHGDPLRQATAAAFTAWGA